MPEEIDIQKLKEEAPEFFAKTPPEIIDFVLSEKISTQINDICVKNGVKDEEKIEAVAYRITWALLGKLPQENLAFTFESGVGLDKETAKKIADEVNELIFSKMPLPKTEKIILQEQKKETKTDLEIPKMRPPKKDAYKEPIE